MKEEREDKYIPADDEKNKSNSPGTTRAERFSTTEAFASEHNEDLAKHEEQKSPNTISS